jgi:hypothetical protein
MAKFTAGAGKKARDIATGIGTALSFVITVSISSVSAGMVAPAGAAVGKVAEDATKYSFKKVIEAAAKEGAKAIARATANGIKRGLCSLR